MHKVNVLMSTYNGEKYIREQIDSILNQRDVEVDITIRDDGSTDKTVEIIEEYIAKQKRIRVIKGRNVGYRKSFLKLLYIAKQTEYYAFSDQDDVWMENKLITAVSHINGNCHCYVSSIIKTDEDLKEINIQGFTKRNTLEAVFVRNRYPGCAMVFDEKIRGLIKNFSFTREDIIPSHDLMVSAISCAIGSIYIDETPFIYHRRLPSSQTAGDGRVLGRIKAEYMVLFKNKYECSTLAREMTNNDKAMFKSEIIRFLTDVRDSKNKWRSRISLMKNKNFSCGIIVCDIETRVKILIGNY